MFIKEKIVENKIFKDKNSKLTKQDKDDIFNKIIDKTNLQVEEKPSLRRKVNLKVVYALACSVVICVLGFIGFHFLSQEHFVDPNYRGKQVELLGLDEDDVCLGYSNKVTINDIKYLNNSFNLSITYSNDDDKYLISKDGEYYIAINSKNKFSYYNIELMSSSDEIISLYNETYNESFTYEILNDNKKGLLFGIKEKGIELYTEKNNVKNSIFVEFE